MRTLAALFSLPVSLLLLISNSPVQAAAVEAQWPYNLPSHVKYFPEDEALVRRNLDIQRRLVGHKPVAVRKMSADEGEMFFLEYWRFDRGIDGWSIQESDVLTPRGDVISKHSLNASIPLLLQPPLLLHSEQPKTPNPLFRRLLRSPLASFNKRDFQCPSDTFSCVLVGAPNSCCPTGQTCQYVVNPSNGLGAVGCCPAGESCSGGVQNCPSGYTGCPDSGGGCCVSGYTCDGIGCVLSSTAIVVVNPTVTASPPTGAAPTTTSPPSLTSSSSIVIASPSITTTTPKPLTCSSGFQSCPSSLGGGCCLSGRLCGSANCPASPSTTSSSSNPPGAPVRPTSIISVSATITSSLSSIPATITASTCPTGFYQCSAYYNGGSCCRVGRDCQLTSCPPSIPSTALLSDGITIVVATPSLNSSVIATVANNAGQAGSCATGWFSCAASAGGGCCPSRYGCETSGCMATNSGDISSSVPKEAASGAAPVFLMGRGVGWGLAGVALGAGVGMVLL